MMLKRFICILQLVLLSAVPLFAFPLNRDSISPKFEPSEKALKWADKQLKKMSVEEKVGQLIHVGVNAKFANQDSEYFQDLKRQVVDKKIGGIIFFGAPIYETTILINRMQALAEVP
ncbi:MAG: hypothetical protein ABI878_11750, partial [Acidobacteriota bacterium]